MRIETRLDGVEVPPDFRELIDQRIAKSLEHHAPHVREVTVRLRDLNGPKGGIDTECSLVAEVAGPKTLVINERAENPSSALTGAAARLNDAVKKHLDKLQNKRS